MRIPKPGSLISACCTALVLATAPQDGLAQDGAKFGFVNISQVITQSDEGRAEAAELEAVGAGMEEELTERRRELEALVQQYEETVSSGEPDTALRARIERLQRELERDVRQAQSDVDTSRQDRIQALGNKAVELVRRFARENGYTAIFRTDGGQVVYAAPEADITDRIIEAYNEAHPVD
ncbi:MAG: OmpH family outer membrane protein [Gammaproteobacteria bacterium]|nr:OmpH family outer membrane protein [Gammaproteobacteria bacterium]